MTQVDIIEKPEEKRFTLVELKAEIQKGIDSANRGDLFEANDVFELLRGKAKSK
jgi:hypothetical protein